MTDKEKIEELKRKLEIARNTLNNIIQSCVHPDIAVRAVNVNLKPIREALKETEYGS